MDGAIVLFDGVCNFCDSSVNFVIPRDKKKYFRFSPIQSTTGQKLIGQYHLENIRLQSLILIENNKAYTYSTAILRMTRKMSGLWPMAYALIIIPALIRDSIYKIIARNRYKWFGKKSECVIPADDVRERYIMD
jgi:predicted DCC family thiol-disulfide oxidoreductase YuxK